MSDVMTKEKDINDIDEKTVIDWLQKNPRFLQKNPDILDILLPPKKKTGKGIADFQYYMVKRLKADRDDVLESAKTIVETSRANMNNLARIHMAVLMLLESTNFEDFIRTITMDFVALLDVDIVSLLVEAEGNNIPHINVPGVKVLQPGTINSLLGKKQILLQSNVEGHESLYGGGATLVKSQALMRLTILPETSPLLIAFGSREPEAYIDGQGTELITFLGKVIERNMRSWLGLN